MYDYCTTSTFSEFSSVFTLDVIASNTTISTSRVSFFNLYVDIWKIKNETKMEKKKKITVARNSIM